MTHTHLGTDRAGNAQLFEGLQWTCRDLARFGVLMLDQGSWHGRRIVSQSWVQQATGHSSTKLNAGYGYLWWLNRKGTLSTPYAAISVKAAAHPTSKQGQIVPGAPAGLCWALGLGNQLDPVRPGDEDRGASRSPIRSRRRSARKRPAPSSHRRSCSASPHLSHRCRQAPACRRQHCYVCDAGGLVGGLPRHDDREVGDEPSA
jgi:hypothetical protein